MLGIAEVDLDVRRDSEALVASHLRTPIPRQRFIQFLRKLAGVSYQSIDDSFRVLAGNLHQHHEPGLAFDECCNLTVGVAEQKIAFPVPGYCSILGRARAFTDRYGIADVRAVLGLQCVLTRSTHRPRTAQVFELNPEGWTPI